MAFTERSFFNMKRVLVLVVLTTTLFVLSQSTMAFDLFGNSQCAVAPYEVKVSYTPIQPQSGECTYCVCLPYGCPDGAPITGGCPVGLGPCGGFGSIPNLGGGLTAVGNLVGTVFSSFKTLANTPGNTAVALAEKVPGGSILSAPIKVVSDEVSFSTDKTFELAQFPLRLLGLAEAEEATPPGKE